MLCFMYVMCWTHIYDHNYGQILGSLSNDDSEGNENGKKNSNNFARASRFFVHFLAFVARLQRKSA